MPDEPRADDGEPGTGAPETESAPAERSGTASEADPAAVGDAPAEPAVGPPAAEPEEGTVALADPPLEKAPPPEPSEPDQAHVEPPTKPADEPDPGDSEKIDAKKVDDEKVGDEKVGDADDAADDDDFDDQDDEPKRSGGLLTRQIKLDARTILVIVAVLALGAGAYTLGQRQAKDLTPAANGGGTPTSNPAPAVPRDFIPFEDEETGIKLSIPKDWPQFSTKDLDPSYRLLLGVPNAKDTLRVRMNAYSEEVTQANIGDQRAVIDAILADETVSILATETLTINGMPTLFYVYRFTSETGEAGIHAHFFVFQGKKMVTMVFEAVPETRYPLLAPVFDAIKDTLVVAPGPPPSFLNELPGSAPSATAVPGSTTVPGAPPATTPPTSTP